MNGINKDKVLSLKQITTKVSNYELEGRQPALSSGSSLPLTVQNADGVLTGNYQLIEFLCLAEFTCGKYTDTTAVNHKEPRLKKNQAIKVSVKQVNDVNRNRIVFA